MIPAGSLVKKGKKALAVYCVDSLNLEWDADNTGWTGWWRIRSDTEQSYDTVLIYLYDTATDSRRILRATRDGELEQVWDERGYWRRRVPLANMIIVGTTTHTWKEFVGATSNAFRGEKRYIVGEAE